MIIRRVREHKYTGQKSISIPKDSKIKTGEYVFCFPLDKKLILELNQDIEIIKLKDIIKNE